MGCHVELQMVGGVNVAITTEPTDPGNLTVEITNMDSLWADTETAAQANNGQILSGGHPGQSGNGR